MKIITLSFPFRLHSGDLPAFRAAIVEVVGFGHHLFHNHDNRNPKITAYHNDYPLIRFAVRKGRPVIIGMAAGADALLRHLLPVLPDTLYIRGRAYATDDYQYRSFTWTPEIFDQPRSMGLVSWLALNKENYHAWKQAEGRPLTRRYLLNRCLTGQLRHMSERLAPELPREQIVADIRRVDKIKRVKWHTTRLVAFHVVADSTLVPPFGIGVGRCSAFGFGESVSPDTYRALTRPRKRAASNQMELA